MHLNSARELSRALQFDLLSESLVWLQQDRNLAYHTHDTLSVLFLI